MWESGNTAETVVLLSRQKPDDTIEIDLDLDELEATSAEPKATYQEIKDYVLKEFGLKVSNLYISQIKRKCGIEVGENYNLPSRTKKIIKEWEFLQNYSVVRTTIKRLPIDPRSLVT